MRASESARVPASMSTPMLTFEEFSAIRQRKSIVSSGFTNDTESHSDDQKTFHVNDNNKAGQTEQKLDFGHLMQVYEAV